MNKKSLMRKLAAIGIGIGSVIGKGSAINASQDLKSMTASEKGIVAAFGVLGCMIGGNASRGGYNMVKTSVSKEKKEDKKEKSNDPGKQIENMMKDPETYVEMSGTALGALGGIVLGKNLVENVKMDSENQPDFEKPDNLK